MLFCCHKCHRNPINHYVSTHCEKYRHFLTIKTYKGWKFGKKSHRQTQFLSEIGADILPSICSIFIARVTLVTAKNQHRCWKARIYAREEDARISTALPLAFLKGLSQMNNKLTFWELGLSFHTFFEVFSLLFRDFFTLWGNIFPYTYRGLNVKRRKAF